MERLTNPERLAGGEIGPELLACLRNIAETTVRAGPRYHDATLNQLTRWITCRSYGGPLHELCHLALIADDAARRLLATLPDIRRPDSGASLYRFRR